MSKSVKICPQCGAENSPDAVYCGFCGTRLDNIPIGQSEMQFASFNREDQEIRCPRCGAKVNPDWTYCKYCGTNLKEFDLHNQPPVKDDFWQGAVQTSNLSEYEKFLSQKYNLPETKNKGKFSPFLNIILFYVGVIVFFYVLFNEQITIVFIGASIPAILILYYFYKTDKSPEPAGLIIKVFIYGALISIPVAIIEFILLAIGILSGIMGFPIIGGLYQSFIIAAIVEEYFKFWAMKRNVIYRPEFDEVRDGIVYGASAALGFATVENVLYALNTNVNIVVLLIMRGFLSVPLHAIVGAFSGYFFANWYFYESRQKKMSLLHVLKISILIHGTYNFALYLADYLHSILLGFAAGITIVVGSYIYLRKIIKKLNEKPNEAFVQSPF